MNDLYIYYKVRATNADQLEMRLRILQAEVGALTGIYGAIKRRPEAKDGVQTWMEVYAATPDGFAAVLAEAEREADIAGLIDGPRHTEVFMDLDPCA